MRAGRDRFLPHARPAVRSTGRERVRIDLARRAVRAGPARRYPARRDVRPIGPAPASRIPIAPRPVDRSPHAARDDRDRSSDAAWVRRSRSRRVIRGGPCRRPAGLVSHSNDPAVHSRPDPFRGSSRAAVAARRTERACPVRRRVAACAAGLPLSSCRRRVGQATGVDLRADAMTPASTGGRHLRKNRRRPTLPGGLPPSTIGAGGLNCRVRNGNGCVPAAMATGSSVSLGCTPSTP
jgi:hypothetical protein